MFTYIAEKSISLPHEPGSESPVLKDCTEYLNDRGKLSDKLSMKCHVFITMRNVLVKGKKEVHYECLETFPWYVHIPEGGY